MFTFLGGDQFNFGLEPRPHPGPLPEEREKRFPLLS
jgi:hypothetical protein